MYKSKLCILVSCCMVCFVGCETTRAKRLDACEATQYNNTNESICLNQVVNDTFAPLEDRIDLEVGDYLTYTLPSIPKGLALELSVENHGLTSDQVLVIKNKQLFISSEDAKKQKLYNFSKDQTGVGIQAIDRGTAIIHIKIKYQSQIIGSYDISVWVHPKINY
jgi:tRNA-binding EMAP/Myf-like protein